MRILVTGSSGQIGTNLALRLLRGRARGLRGRQAPEPVGRRRTFPTLLQDLAGHYSAFPGGINGVEYPEVDLVVHLAAHAKVHQLVRQPHRALENAIMTFNVLEFARGMNCRSSTRRRARCTATCTGSRSTPRRPPTSPSPRARTPRRRSPARRSSTPMPAATASATSSSASRTSTAATTPTCWRMERVLPLWMHQLSRGEPITIFGGDEKVLDFTYIDDCVDGIARGVYALGGRRSRERDDQPRVRPGQHARARRRADRRRARRRADRQPWRRRCSARSRTTSPTSARPTTCSAGRRRRRSTRASRRRSRGSRSGGRRTPRRTGRSSARRRADELDHGFKQPAGAGA